MPIRSFDDYEVIAHVIKREARTRYSYTTGS